MARCQTLSSGITHWTLQIAPQVDAAGCASEPVDQQDAADERRACADHEFQHFERHGVVFGRPLLELPSAALRAWLQSAGHAFVDDPSNADQRYTRNRIRAVLMPAWDQAFPGFREALARTAAHAAQGQRLLDDVASIDLAQTGEPPAIDALRALSRDRQANALRRWLRRREGVAASTAQLDDLLDQIEACRTRGHRIHIKVAAGFVDRDGPRLTYTPSV